MENRQRPDPPKMLCYSVLPNDYLNAHAAEIQGLYDGFYFQCGTWDQGVAANIGLPGEPATNPEWLALARQNVAALTHNGITENLLAVAFGSGDPWPSPETLLSDAFTEKMGRHFQALGKAARECGFRGVSIDLEYPYPRYELDHPQYVYDTYTPGDLKAAAYRQGRACMAALLDEFPEAVVFLLPGGIRTRPLEVQMILGFMDEMAERDAPGGCHLASEYSYRMHDPVTAASVPVFDECRMGNFVSEATIVWWKRRGSVAPGVWAFHMAESEEPDYPVRPWADEMAERRQQMRILRSLSPRYMWSYSSYAAWFTPSEATRRIPGVRFPDFDGAEHAIPLWHGILRDKTRYDELPEADPRMLRLFEAVRAFRSGETTPEELCDAFGTPGRWLVLGPLSTPHTSPRRTADEALGQPIKANRIFCGRDGAVRWFTWFSHDPRGIVNTRSVFDFLAADDMSMHIVAWLHSDREREVVLNVGHNDGVIVRVGDAVVLDKPELPAVPHRGFFRDRYQFEELVRVTVPRGKTRLAVTVICGKESWRFAFRVTDRDGYPVERVRFTAETED
ncbi:MAG: hypothetical protein BWY06_00964 [Candidatus Latescibacteria bacterium ADurb.Bin168]|nr:MAG: hypothetical protein BWY06_00964 [Candidatus Latescibacteria bacterium ADurb.Bin168]